MISVWRQQFYLGLARQSEMVQQNRAINYVETDGATSRRPETETINHTEPPDQENGADKLTDNGKELDAAHKIDLLKKVQDLMQNQVSEEHKSLRKKERDLGSLQKKFFKICLRRELLDKFKPKDNNGIFEDFGVHLVLSSRQ